ncbi:hypothetical protein SAMN04515692_11133 [Leifsonia sp. CL147]|nr:hypothetical protein SAMN04515694_11133 [Leifsonia sp. CL154]SFL74096.1 hypothetical protein SAMN04515692_11133 [Leifsonia sp. CL147]
MRLRLESKDANRGDAFTMGYGPSALWVHFPGTPPWKCTFDAVDEVKFRKRIVMVRKSGELSWLRFRLKAIIADCESALRQQVLLSQRSVG